ncbi:MAG: hypothetical protein HYX63_00150 [Gammaproteobacteria bacterium]|nr:hypothetical protein [Gammaproteobacteria bacterium]
MASRFRITHWWCLVAYLWAATGMGDTALVNALLDADGHDSIVFEPAPDAELIAHHVGHRDAHEPHAIDNAAHPTHADHILKLDGTKQANGFLAKDLKGQKFADGKSLAIALPIEEPNPILMHPSMRAVCSSRNSALAFVKLAQLRL